MTKRKTSTLSIRIQDEVKEMLEKSAVRENRSITNYLETLIINDYKDKHKENLDRP